MITFDSVNSVHAVWTDDGASYVYTAMSGTIHGNDDSKSLRFTLHEIDDQDYDFEVVIQEKADGSYIFKTDYYENPEHEYPLKRFSADGESVFYFKGKEGIAYFHVGELAKSEKP